MQNQLAKFLEPHTKSAILAKLDEKSWANYYQHKTVYEKQLHNRTSGTRPLRMPAPLHFHDYVIVKELRVDALEWVRNDRRLQQGAHFPLCIKIGGIGRRSERAQQARQRGNRELRQNFADKKGRFNHGTWNTNDCRNYANVRNRKFTAAPTAPKGRNTCVSQVLWCTRCQDWGHFTDACPQGTRKKQKDQAHYGRLLPNSSFSDHIPSR